MFPLVYPFNTFSPIQEKSPEPAFPTDVSSASVLRVNQPPADGVLTSEVQQSLEACKLIDTDLAVAEDPSDANAGRQTEWMQTNSLGNVDVASMNTYSVLLVSLNKDNRLVKAVP